MLKTAIVVGLVAGLVVGGFHNVVTVPVIEEAIAFEEAAAAEDDGEDPLVSLGAQRVGLVIGQAIFGVLLGALFVPLRSLAVKAVAHGRLYLVVAVAAAIGFWSVSLLPALKYPPNPPGVGEAESLAFRQGFQFLFVVVSIAAAMALLAFLARGRNGEGGQWARSRLAALGAAYLGVVAVLFIAFPANDDPVTAPAELVDEFRRLSVIGHLLTWALIGAGIAVFGAGRPQVVPAPGAR